jgi:benzylsuccinate CoA-transferase BbsF subunit
VAPLFNAIALIAALDYRRRTGEGQCLDVSQHEATMHRLEPLFLDSVVNRREPKPEGNRLASAAPHGIYRCQGEDRWCAIAVFTDDEWANFCRVIGSPTWTKDPKFNTLLGRKQNEDELDRRVEEWTSQHTPEKVMSLMQGAGIGAGLVADAKDLSEDPQLNHYQCYQELEHPEVGRMSFYLPPAYSFEAPISERVLRSG